MGSLTCQIQPQRNETILRSAIVSEARSWLGTPYHLGACLKGAGCDCATLLLGIYQACGLIGEEELGVFSGDWFHHASREEYMMRVLRHAYKVAETTCYRSTQALPGNIVLTRTPGSRLYNHGCLVLDWPHVVHAIHPGVMEIDASRDPMWAFEQIAIFDPFVPQNVSRET